MAHQAPPPPAGRFTPWSRLPTSPSGEALAVRTVCVIGAGSSGLVAAKHLRDAGYIVTVYERTSCLGGAFVHKAYDESGLVSSKYLTSFSDLRPSPSDPPHLSLAAYVDYLREYARQERLHNLITYGAHVAAVREREDGKPGYTVSVEPVSPVAYPAGEGDGDENAAAAAAAAGGEGGRAPAHLRAAEAKDFDAVCVCSGLHEAPYAPRIPGIESYSGMALHSAQYKDKALFAGKRVLVIGCGETGMDLCYRAVQVASSVCLSIKRGFLSVPHEGWGGVPLDTLIANLFEHSYEHWWLHKHHLKWKFTTWFIRLGFFFSTGSSVGYNQYVGRLDDIKRGYHILCKSTAAMPYLNRPVKQNSWRRYIPWWADHYHGHQKVDKSIDTKPMPQEITGRTVTFTDGSTFDADVLVYATGYRQTFPFLHSEETSPNRTKLEEADEPPPSCEIVSEPNTHSWVPCTGARGAEDPLPSEHFIVSPDAPRLAFIGFVRPNVGAIPPMAELQTFWWIQRLKGEVVRGIESPSYGLLGKKLNYGVDYGNYMHQLAAEIGAAPTLSDLIWSPKALIAYSFGQAYISFFRLVGPFKSESAGWDVAKGELLRPVLTRGLWANVIFVMTMGLFAWLNIVCLVIESVLMRLRPDLVEDAKKAKHD